MPNLPISGFTSGSPAQSGDEFVVARSGANFKLATSDLQSYVAGYANLFTAAQTFHPVSDVSAITARRYNAGATSNILQLQDQSNNLLAYFDKDGKLTVPGATVSGGSLTLSGNISAPAWTTSGIRYKNVAATLTDTSSSGTVAAAYTNVYGGNTIAASNSTTFTDYFTTYISPPTAGTNVTMTNKWALGLGGNLQVNGTTSLVGGTVTASSPVIDAAQTWNAGAVTFTGWKLNVTDTASASGSLLMDLQLGGTGRFQVTKSGNVQLGLASSTDTFIYFDGANRNYALEYYNTTYYWYFNSKTNTTIQFDAGGTQTVLSGGAYRWSSNATSTYGNAADLILTRRAAANLRFGAADAASPVAQTLSVQSVVAGTTNTAGTDLTITGSQGTGTGAGGSIIFQVAPAGSSGTAQNALATALTIASSGAITGTNTFSTTAMVLSGAGMRIRNDSANLTMGSSDDIKFERDAAGTLALRNGTNAQAYRIYNTYTSATNFERANIAWSSNTLTIGTEKGSGGGTARDLVFQTDGTTRLTIASTGAATFASSVTVAGTRVISSTGIYYGNFSLLAGSSAGRLKLSNGPETGFDLLIFGPSETTSFPALKRSSTTLQVRLADDSAYGNLAAGQVYTPTQTLTDGATITFNANLGAAATVTLAGTGRTLTPSNLVDGGTYLIVIKQDATGNRTITTWTNFKWPGGTAPVLSTAANAVDIVTGWSDGTYIYASIQQGYA